MSHFCSIYSRLAGGQSRLPFSDCLCSLDLNARHGSFGCFSRSLRSATNCSKLDHLAYQSASNHQGNGSLSSLSYVKVLCFQVLTKSSESAYSAKPTNFVSSPFFRYQVVLFPVCLAYCFDYPWGQ